MPLGSIDCHVYEGCMGLGLKVWGVYTWLGFRVDG